MDMLIVCECPNDFSEHLHVIVYAAHIQYQMSGCIPMTLATSDVLLLSIVFSSSSSQEIDIC